MTKTQDQSSGEASIFTRIINGEIPSHKVYEDGLTFAFMDIYPTQPGQVLVVPKRQVDVVWDLEEREYQAVMATARRVAQRIRQVYPEKARVGMQIEGLDVAHAHLKIFAFDTAADFRRAPDTTVEPDHAKLAAIAAKLAI